MEKTGYGRRVEECTILMKEAGIDVLLLTKPSNMRYLTGDGRLCAYTMITRDGAVGVGVRRPTLMMLRCTRHSIISWGLKTRWG
jgi:hypothetical protein